MSIEFIKGKSWRVDSKQYCMAIDKTNNFLVTGGKLDATISVWNINTGEKINSWLIHEPLSHIPYENTIYSLDISYDGKLLANAGGTHLWDLTSGQSIRNFKRWSNQVKLVPNSNLMISTFSDEIVLWSIERGKKIWRSVMDGTSEQIIISPDGKDIVVRDRFKNRIQIWNSVDRTKSRRININSPSCFDSGGISSDLQLLVLCGSRGIQLCNYQTGEPTLLINKIDYKPIDDCFKHLANVGFLSISPEGNIIVTNGGDGCMRFWNTINGENIADFKYGLLEISFDWSKLISLIEDRVQVWHMKISYMLYDI